MSTRTKSIAGMTLAVILMAIATIVVLVFAKPSHPASPSNVAQPVAGANQYVVPNVALEVPPVQLDGKWLAKTNDTGFTAQIKNNTIKIDMIGSDETSFLYWSGSFKSEEVVGNTIASNADGADFVLSQDDTKDFAVGENTLTFEFRAMGMKKMVVLSRG